MSKCKIDYIAGKLGGLDVDLLSQKRYALKNYPRFNWIVLICEDMDRSLSLRIEGNRNFLLSINEIESIFTITSEENFKLSIQTYIEDNYDETIEIVNLEIWEFDQYQHLEVILGQILAQVMYLKDFLGLEPTSIEIGKVLGKSGSTIRRQIEKARTQFEKSDDIVYHRMKIADKNEFDEKFCQNEISILVSPSILTRPQTEIDKFFLLSKLGGYRLFQLPQNLDGEYKFDTRSVIPIEVEVFKTENQLRLYYSVYGEETEHAMHFSILNRLNLNLIHHLEDDKYEIEDWKYFEQLVVDHLELDLLVSNEIKYDRGNEKLDKKVINLDESIILLNLVSKENNVFPKPDLLTSTSKRGWKSFYYFSYAMNCVPELQELTAYAREQNWSESVNGQELEKYANRILKMIEKLLYNRDQVLTSSIPLSSSFMRKTIGKKVGYDVERTFTDYENFSHDTRFDMEIWIEDYFTILANLFDALAWFLNYEYKLGLSKFQISLSHPKFLEAIEISSNEIYDLISTNFFQTQLSIVKEYRDPSVHRYGINTIAHSLHREIDGEKIVDEVFCFELEPLKYNDRTITRDDSTITTSIKLNSREMGLSSNIETVLDDFKQILIDKGGSIENWGFSDQFREHVIITANFVIKFADSILELYSNIIRKLKKPDVPEAHDWKFVFLTDIDPFWTKI